MTRRNSYLLRVYGITEEQYSELLERQGGGCAICHKLPDTEGQSLAVDHDHKTGEIRGLLCRYCNHRVIGRHTNADLLHRMAEYVERHTGWFVPAKKCSRRRKKNARSKK